VVSVSSDGEVVGIGEGSASVTVTYQGDSAVANVTVMSMNQPPIAIAGSDAVVGVGGETQLDGSSSADPDGDSLTYFWETVSQPGGSNPTLVPTDSATPVFTPDISGDYVVKLTVDDGKNETGSDTVLITAWQSGPSVFRATGKGDVASDGSMHASSFQTGAADVAEWVRVQEDVELGDVLSLDPTNPQTYRLSQTAYWRLVSGVVSSSPGISLGRTDAVGPKALLALVGIVPVKVTSEGGLIQPGDLLVTSSTPGHAMRWAGDDPCPCALIGKALEPMTDESGMILVLLTAH
jgi:hypothetical protein